jgi:hypothetical protein
VIPAALRLLPAGMSVRVDERVCKHAWECGPEWGVCLRVCVCTCALARVGVRVAERLNQAETQV